MKIIIKNDNNNNNFLIIIIIIIIIIFYLSIIAHRCIIYTCFNKVELDVHCLRLTILGSVLFKECF